ncbi:cyclin-A2-2-like [Pyrus ussuriensis x Pyrus communis]|uniref:B-like cyclin n=1 Tax=Pyrus ussuriensis x Pyrus communis TaxID=2448454 RepID=A0A5N5HPA3_9ROSA|nr:cyclin-A2-2-like [Pyrus ussuriensis x Pyrus communis]
MNKENANAAKVEDPNVRITRARSKAFGASSEELSSSKLFIKQDQKRGLRAISKRAASDENKASAIANVGLQHKRRAVLKDVGNITSESSYVNCTDASQIQTNKQARRGLGKNVKVASTVSEAIPIIQDDVKAKLAEELSKIRVAEPLEPTLPKEPVPQGMCHTLGQHRGADLMLTIQAPAESAELWNPQKKEEYMVGEIVGSSNVLDIVNIDSNLRDPLACSLYAPDIYSNICLTEVARRPSTDYMERLQQDITPSMRGILIDWLVEVSEEYKLVPDTLYLTVNLIDRFLSQNYIEKQRLQLLGVTCMLIASKYEEICAPQVEEFCIITDNTYSREEVLKMESQVLNFMHFQLSVPTIKTFLRRFIHAAQASYKVPCVELELLANYLAELALVEYGFLKFLPSLIAASAVFLARWTLNQSDHPWNPTLEHYTSYKTSQLKTTVVALEDLQLNTTGCLLNSIREKYKHQKFKSVATLTSKQRVVHSFEDQ